MILIEQSEILITAEVDSPISRFVWQLLCRQHRQVQQQLLKDGLTVSLVPPPRYLEPVLRKHEFLT